jgi:hypothetical protein
MNNSTNNFNITIDSNSDDFTNIEHFLCELYINQNKTNPYFNSIKISYVRGGDSPKIFYKLPLGDNILEKYINVIYKDTNITFNKYIISKDHGTNHKITYLYEIHISAPNKEILDNLLFDICEDTENQVIFHYKSKEGYWQRYGNVQKRDEATLIINKEDKNKFLTDVEDFVKSEKDYDYHGISYKRNYLLYGKPGTGKTSLVNVIANKTNRNINILSFDNDLTDSGLYCAISQISGDKAILLLEDIDCIFHERTVNNSKVSFAAVLNILDGVIRSKGLITIITTNHIKKLDKALLRPGRIDMMLEFNIISKEQIDGLLAFYKINIEPQTKSELVKICQKHELTPGMLTGFMFRNRKLPLDNSNYIELLKIYLSEIDIILSDSSNSMYT